MRSAALALMQALGRVSAAAPSAQAAVQPLVALRAAAAPWTHAATRWSHCSCSGDLSLPPPQKVVVEYAPAAVDAFIALADAVEAEFEGILVDGVEVPDRPGAFDVKLEDGRCVFSAGEQGGAGAEPPAEAQYSDLFERLRRAGLQAAAA